MLTSYIYKYMHMHTFVCVDLVFCQSEKPQISTFPLFHICTGKEHLKVPLTN